MTNENTSIVIIDHNDAAKLENAIREHLSVHNDNEQVQDENSQNETIIVVDKGKKESEELLERMKPQFPDIHITFVPDSSRRMSDQKIAILLGVRAASNDRIELIDTLYRGFSPFRQFSCMQRHRSLSRRGGGFDFEMNEDALFFSKSKFLKRDAFEKNISFIHSCYEPPSGQFAKRCWMRVKYVLHKCHLYPA